ncbi:extracellular solute-binding protein, partial [Kibdelosporangium lantanae]
MDLSHGKIRQALIDDWNQKHPDTPVKVVKLPSSADLQHAQMLAAEQAGDTTYDVLNLDLTWTAEFADNNAIVPLDNEMLGDGDFVAKALESARYRDRLWAVPFNTDVGLLYYRKDIVGSKGLPLPTKWGDLVDAKQSVQPPMRVFTTQLKRYEGLTVNVVEASASQNEDLSGSGGLLALAAGLRDGTILPESTTYDEAGALEAFRGDNAMFMRNWPYAYDVMASDMLDFPKKVGVTRLPWPAVLGGQNLAVARNSTKPRLARELIEFLTSPN